MGHIDCMDALLQRNRWLPSDHHGDTLIICAARGGQTSVIEYLLSEKFAGCFCANLSERNVYGWSPFLLAAKHGNVDCCQLLLSKGADPLDRGPSGQNALMQAASSGDSDLVEFFIDKGIDVHAVDQKCNNVLAFSRTESCTRLLIARGVAIDHRSASGYTPLMQVEAKHWLESCSALLAAGANVNAVTEHGDSALRCAIDAGSLPIVTLLLENNADCSLRFASRTMLIEAARVNSVDISAALLQRKIDVNASDKDGNTALHVASRSSNAALVELLLKHQANPNQLTSSEVTPLALSAFAGSVECCTVLLAHGADLNFCDSQGNSALSIAIEQSATAGDSNLVASLLQHEPIAAIRQSSLFVAVEGNHVESVRLLLNYGVDISQLNLQGLTALDIATDRAFHDIVELLRSSVGSSTPASDSSIDTPAYKNCCSPM